MPGFIIAGSHPSPSQNNRVEAFLKDVNDTAAHAQNAYLLFLVTGTYLAITIGSTTDEQLLRVSNVTLPLLNIGIPILAFYILAPWLTLLLHFNLLLQIYILATKLHALDTTVATLESQERRDDYRRQLFPFPLSHLLIGHHHVRFMRFLFFVVVWITMILFPLLLLLASQIRFLPYHDEWITLSQQTAIVLEILLLWVLWPRIVKPKGQIWIWWKQAFLTLLLWAPLRTLARLIIHNEREHLDLRVQSTPGSPVLLTTRTTGSFAMLILAPVLLIFSLGVAVVPDSRIEQLLAAGLQSCKLSSFLVSKNLVTKQPTFVLTSRIFREHIRTNRQRLPRSFFHRNLDLTEGVFVANEPSSEIVAALHSRYEKEQREALQKIIGINLAGRDLRFANFSRSVLPKADLRAAQLQGAVLELAQLHGALVSEAQLHGATLSRAQLHGAVLRRTQLQGATMWKTQLQGADLQSAQLQGADAEGIQLQGSILDRAQLQGADLEDALLLGTSLEGAQLQGVDLQDAQLQAANLFKANLQGANLSGAQLQGATLSFAQIQGAVLYGAVLRGATLYGAWIGSADFLASDLSLSDVRAIKRTPLTQENFFSIGNVLRKGTTDPYLHSKDLLEAPGHDIGRVLESLQKRIEQPDSLDRASLQKAGCDLSLRSIKDECSRSAETYEKRLFSYLVELSCQDADMTRGIARRIPWRLKADQTMTPQFREKLAKALLKANCRGNHTLPESIKKNLLKIATGERIFYEDVYETEP